MYSEEFIRGQSVTNKISIMMDNLNFKNNLQNPLYNNMYQNLVNNKVDLLAKMDAEILDVKTVIERTVSRANNFIDLVGTRFDYFKMYQYFNEQNKKFNLQYNISFNEVSRDKIRRLNDRHFSDHNNKLMPGGNDIQYFTKYSNANATSIVTKTNQFNFQIQDIGIQFLSTGVGTQNFTDVKYDPRILPGYFSAIRYRMLEELVLDIHYNSKTTGPPPSPKKVIYDMVKKYVTDNLGQVNPLMERPLILSIIGDLIDNHLISNVKKALFDAVTELVNEQISPNTGTSLPLIVQSTNPSTGPNVEIQYSAVDFDVEFGLNLGEQDDLVSKALNKITVMSIDKSLNLSFGDMLLSNKIKKKAEIGENDDDAVAVVGTGVGTGVAVVGTGVADAGASAGAEVAIQQIFYPSNFLSTLNSSPKCTIYDPEIANLIDSDKLINLDRKDYYGNTPLYYAINSQNYLFAKKLIEKNARILNIKNNDDQNPFVYILEKLTSLCNFFGKESNIIMEFNNYYTISLKEEVKKLENHGNIMQNLDKVILLYLFLLNSSFFNEMFKKDHELIKLLKIIYDDVEYNLFNSDSNYQNDFNLIFMNPIHKIHQDNASSTDVKKKNIFSKFDVVINLQKDLQSKLDSKEKEKDALEAKKNNFTSIQTLLKPTDISYATNIQDNVSKLDTDINKLGTDIAELTKQLNKATTNIAYPTNTKFTEPNLQFTDIFQQIFQISKSYNKNKMKDFTFRPFLKALHELSKDPDFYNNTYFFHSLISKIICQFVEYSKKIMNAKLINNTQLKNIKSKLDKIINIMKKTMYKNIFHKNNNVKNIDSNPQLNDEFMRICFTIDIAVGNTYYKVLKRLMMTFLKSRYPVSNENADKYLQFIKQKVDPMLNKVNKYIQPDMRTDTYKPSELTKKMVLLNGGYKSTKHEYSSSDENEFFEFITDAIKNNGFEKIDDNEPVLKYLRKQIHPYFINYYRICISKIINANNSYENFILNQYHNLNMFDLLLNKLIEEIKKNEKNKDDGCDINTC